MIVGFTGLDVNLAACRTARRRAVIGCEVGVAAGSRGRVVIIAGVVIIGVVIVVIAVVVCGSGV